MVATHAHTIRPATPQRTADSRLVAPTPTIAPVIVWVVDTGMPRKVARYSEEAAAVSAENPPIGLSAVIRCPSVLTIRQPPDSVPRAIAPLANISRNPSAKPSSGDSTMNSTVFSRLAALITAQPALARPAPTKPPISACDEEVGRPSHQVVKFHATAPTRPANTTASEAACG